jgi:hypothetical protein
MGLPLVKLVLASLVADELVALEPLPHPVIKNRPAATGIKSNTLIAAI